MAAEKEARPLRIRRIARKIARRAEVARSKGNRPRKKPFRRTERRSRVRPIIAYDLETTRIEAGTPRPLYLTAYGESFHFSGRILSIEHLGEILSTRFLTLENKGTRFVAWNGNNFDAYYIGAALLHCDEYVIRPYLTNSQNLRGFSVSLREDSKQRWEFLDGIAMTGLQGVSLEKFLKLFAPDYLKLDAPDWEREEFDASNADHVAYAERDSEGLFHGMMRAQGIIRDAFDEPLQGTIGNTGIRIFTKNIPAKVAVWEPSLELMDVIRGQVMRGGYCVCMRKHRGPVWKYDLNQAYAAAMRDCWLPGGRVMKLGAREPTYAKAAILRIRATHRSNKIPFYYRRGEDERAEFGLREIADTWITKPEHDQLKAEGWHIEVLDCAIWEDAFRMVEFVNRLEHLRMNAEGGPSGAIGTMIKAVGNNSYGKTVEELSGIELMLSKSCPEGFHEYQPESDLLRHVYFRFAEPTLREYHQPQIGAFITAHVRMVLRRAALMAGDSFIYADTDCIVSDKPLDLPIDPKRYGYWKLEEAGEPYIIVTKKVYASESGDVKHAKGLNVSRLTSEDFLSWYADNSPVQVQIQRVNWLKAMQGADMFREHRKRGSKQAA